MSLQQFPLVEGDNLCEKSKPLNIKLRAPRLRGRPLSRVPQHSDMLANATQLRLCGNTLIRSTPVLVRLCHKEAEPAPASTPPANASTGEKSDSSSSDKDPFARFPENTNPKTGEVGGPTGPEPTRYGDWERKGRVTDF